MKIHVLTLFPGMFTGVLEGSILGRAREKGLVRVDLVQIRDFAKDRHRTTDDLPYGGGPGMVMKPEPLYEAWRSVKEQSPESLTIFLTPQGTPLQQSLLEDWSKSPGRALILVCGRYEGIDERFLEECVDLEVSLGDFVLSGGELGAMVLIDGLMRLLPGALGNSESPTGESFSAANDGLLEYPQYTRPPEFRGRKVPDILLSGDHAKIAQWRKGQSLERTRRKRPDLLSKG